MLSTWNDLGHLPDTQGYSGLISPLKLQGGCWGGGWSIRLAQRPKSSLDWDLASGLSIFVELDIGHFWIFWIWTRQWHLGYELEL